MAKRDMAALAARTASAARLDTVTRPPALAGMLQIGAPGARLQDSWAIPLDRIVINPQQVRQHFDEAALAGLTDSVRELGVLEPILVRPAAEGRYQIVAGERRYRAAQAAGLPTIPARVVELDDAEAVTVTVTENLQREDLSAGDEARQYAWAMAALDISQRELGRRLGIDNKRIGRLLTILEQAPALLEAIDNGELSVNAALGQLDSGYYRDTSLFRMGTTLQAGSSLEQGAPPPAADPVEVRSQAGTRQLQPEDFPADAPAPRVTRLELIDPTKADQVARAFKPAAHFANYVSRLQPADVAPPDRVPLAERLEAAAREASLLARALRQAAGEDA